MSKYKRKQVRSEQAKSAHKNSPATTKAKDVTWVQGLFLILLTCLCYIPAMRAGFIWDDDDYVTANHALKSAKGLFDIWFRLGTTPQYYPLVHTTFWIEYHVWELWAPGYHVINILIHATNCILVWRILKALEVPASLLIAAVFAVHPVEVESVAWATERKNVLSGFFYLLALLCYLRSSGNFRASIWNWKWYSLSLLAFTAAMFSKTVAFSLPAAMLLIEWWKTGRIRALSVLRLLPFFALGAALALITIHVEEKLVGARGKEWDLSFGQRLLIAGRALWFYIGKLLLPWKLTFIYPKWHVAVNAWWQWLFPVTIFLLLGTLALSIRALGRGPLAAVLFFCGTLFPALGFFNIYPMRYSYVADHFQYLAGLGIITLVCAACAKRLSSVSNQATVIAAAAIITLGAITFKQCFTYRDLETLWRDVIRKNPGAGIAHGNLGNLLTERGDVQQAMTHYNQALRIDPEDEIVMYNKGLAHYRQGQLDEAVNSYNAALKVRPQYPEAYYNLGKALEKKGLNGDALRNYDLAIACSQNFSPPLAAKGALLVTQGNLGGARLAYEAALKIDPNDPVVPLNLAEVYANSNAQERALENFRKCVQLDPQDAQAHLRLANIAEELSKRDEAIQHYRKAFAIDPNQTSAKARLTALGVKP